MITGWPSVFAARLDRRDNLEIVLERARRRHEHVKDAVALLGAHRGATTVAAIARRLGRAAPGAGASRELDCRARFSRSSRMRREHAEILRGIRRMDVRESRWG